MKNIVMKFNSLNEFGEYLKRNASNKTNWEGHDMDSQRESTSDWYGTRNWQEAERLFLFGDMESAKKIENGSTDGKPIQSIKPQTKSRTVLSCAGYAPCVPAYLAGSQRTMYRKVTVKTRAKVLTVVYNISANGGWSSTALAQASFKMLQAIYKLEQKSGVRVNLYICDCSLSKGQYIMPVVKIKDSGQYFNLAKVAYPLVNPSMMRRHGFRWQEVTMGVNHSFVYNYGGAVYDNTVVANLIKTNLPTLKPDYVFGINDAARCKDSDEVISKLFTNKK